MNSTGLETLLEGNTAEILSRNSIQYQITLGALAGLALIVSQAQDIQNSDNPLIYCGASILFGLLGLIQLEQDRLIAVLGGYRKRLETEIVSPLDIPGWEEYRDDVAPKKAATVFANSARYMMTLGACAFFAVAFYRSTSANDDLQDQYDWARLGMIAVLVVVVMAAVILIGLIQTADKTRSDTGGAPPDKTGKANGAARVSP